jgi:GNAT superfamily N-acetyltransferase
MHARYYSRAAGFGMAFERIVAGGLVDFTGRLGHPGNALWVAEVEGRIVGSIAIDGEDHGGGVAHLRWFILDEAFRGAGIGRRQLDEAVGFSARERFHQILLWTFQGLDAARRLYEAAGFVPAEERPGEQWGSNGGAMGEQWGSAAVGEAAFEIPAHFMLGAGRGVAQHGRACPQFCV